DTLPVQNLETAFWLESDRMLELAFTTKSLEVQRNVVIEEFKQRYLNQPYGDVWLELRPLVYQNHPYRWATIGKKIEHIAEATMEDVKNFFYKHYGPQNAVLVIGGNTNLERVKELSEKWFGMIPSRDKHQRSIDSEPSQSEARTKTIEREVPSDAIYIAFRMGNRTSEEHYTGDLASGILSSGTSSRMYNELVVKRRMFSNISAYITGGWEDGLFVVSGQLSEEVSIADAEAAVWAEMNNLKNNPPEGRELSKVKNKIKTAKVFSEQTLMNRVLKIAMFELMGEIEEINYELNRYDKITGDDIKSFAEKVFRKENSSTLYILKSDG
ncbi:insulinase family protein, partial [Crocinitomix catalasitica]|nr:insulinase family protein [Crocinitomix catalasitica]